LPTVRPAVGRARGEQDEQEARVAGSVKRERQLAREHYERQQARRAARAAKQRRIKQVAAVVVAALVLAAGVVGLSVALGGDDEVQTTKPKASASGTPSASETPSPSASSTPGAGCVYTKAGEASKDVGLPAYDASKAARYRKPFSATVATDQGDVVIDLAAAKAPCTTNSFRHLAEAKYFDGTSCHRLTTGNIYVLQCGDPTGTGSGGPGYQFPEENVPAEGQDNYPAGTVAMANAGPGTNGSQFFLVYKDTTLPAGYTIFGKVTKGLDVVQKVADAGSDESNGAGDGKPKLAVTIKTVTVGKA
jgi:peptidyl-prolyl cis-trans isomerase B (cyclophilin B)